MKKFHVNFGGWREKLTKSITDFVSALKVAVIQQFNLKFLKILGIVLVIAAAISAIILSFMHSTRIGWWSVAIEVLMLLGLMIAGIAGNSRKSRLRIFGSYILWTACIIGVSYLIGWMIISLLPGDSPSPYELEASIGLGILIIGLLCYIGCIINADYKEGLRNGTSWKNKTEYTVRILRKLILFAVGIGAIYAFVHFLSPMIG